MSEKKVKLVLRKNSNLIPAIELERAHRIGRREGARKIQDSCESCATQGQTSYSVTG